MHVGPDIKAQSLQWGRGRGCRFASCLFSYNLARREPDPGQGSPCCLWQFCFCADWAIFVLPFHGGGPHADPHLGLGPLPSAPVGWEE